MRARGASMGWIVVVVVLAGAAVAVWAVVSVARHALETRLGSAGAELRRLADAAAWRDRGTDDVRREVASFPESLDQMRVAQEERRVRGRPAWGALPRGSSGLARSQRNRPGGADVLRVAGRGLASPIVEPDISG